MDINFYTYLHCKPNGDPFYVGKGCDIPHKRSHQFNCRNQHHKNVVEKYGKENIGIFVFQCESEKQAFADEVQQIAQLRRKGYELCNQTNGGEGAVGRVVSIESRKKMSIAKNNISEETRKKMSQPKSLKHRLAMSTQRKGRPAHNKGIRMTEEQKEKIRIAKQFISVQTREKISMATKGMKRRLGAVLSDETKKKISEAHLRFHQKRRLIK